MKHVQWISRSAGSKAGTVSLLDQGKTYRQITTMTGISKSTLIRARNQGARYSLVSYFVAVSFLFLCLFAVLIVQDHGNKLFYQAKYSLLTSMVVTDSQRSVSSQTNAPGFALYFDGRDVFHTFFRICFLGRNNVLSS